MATVTIRPNTDISGSGSTTPSSQPYYSVIDEETLDTGDYIHIDEDQYFSVGFSNVDLSGWTINSVTIVGNMGAAFNPSVNSVYIPTTEWSDDGNNYYSLALINDPATGLAWAESGVNSLIFSVSTSWNKGIDIFQVYAVVDYGEAPSGTTHEGEVALSSLSYLRTKKA